MMARRAFLSQLAHFPLIGGGVAILGQPTAVAEPVTTELLMEYNDWLGWERSRLCEELYGDSGRMCKGIYSFMSRAYDWHRGPRPNATRPTSQFAAAIYARGPCAERCRLRLAGVAMKRE